MHACVELQKYFFLSGSLMVHLRNYKLIPALYICIVESRDLICKRQSLILVLYGIRP